MSAVAVDSLLRSAVPGSSSSYSRSSPLPPSLPPSLPAAAVAQAVSVAALVGGRLWADSGRRPHSASAPTIPQCRRCVGCSLLEATCAWLLSARGCVGGSARSGQSVAARCTCTLRCVMCSYGSVVCGLCCSLDCEMVVVSAVDCWRMVDVGLSVRPSLRGKRAARGMRYCQSQFDV